MVSSTESRSLREEATPTASQDDIAHDPEKAERPAEGRAKTSDNPDSHADAKEWKWDDDPSNPYNWPLRLKIRQIVMLAAAAFTS